MSNENLDEIKRLIDSMQSGLVELFDQLRELRRRLDITGIPMPSDTQSSVISLFTGVEKSSLVNPDDVTTEPVPPSHDIETLRDEEESESIISSTSKAIPEPESKDIAVESNPPSELSEVEIEPKSDDSVPIGSAKVARVLDPISHELRTGEAPASVLAEYLQSAKDYLFSGDSSNERVQRDMEVVLKFLKARNTKGIRPEERDNILKRIDRWKEALVETL